MEQVITADDVVRLGGACSDGVRKIVVKNAAAIAAAMPVSDVLAMVSSEADQQYVLKAAGLGDGDGDGDGYGLSDGGKADGDGGAYQ